MFKIAASRCEDHDAIEHLLDRAFGPDRKAKTSYRYRDDVRPVDGLALVARDGERLVGAINYWPILIGRQAAPALLLGPLAVEPTRKGTGIGAALIRTSLAMARAAGHRIVLLVGERDYYGRFGFEPAGPHGIVMPGEPDRLMLTTLVDDALDTVRGAVRRADKRRYVRRHVLIAA